MSDSICASLHFVDHEHRRVVYVEGRVVGWTGTRAQYDWHIMSAPAVGPEQVAYFESTPLAEYPPFHYRGEAIAALRRHAEVNQFDIVERSDETQQLEERYSEALEQEIHELHAWRRQVLQAQDLPVAVTRLHELEIMCSQLRDILSDHFASHQVEWAQIQSLLQCCENDAPNSE